MSAALMLAFEHRYLVLPLVAILIVVHRLAIHLRTRKYLPPDQRANWSAVALLTTVSSVMLPFYLALTID